MVFDVTSFVKWTITNTYALRFGVIVLFFLPVSPYNYCNSCYYFYEISSSQRRLSRTPRSFQWTFSDDHSLEAPGSPSTRTWHERKTCKQERQEGIVKLLPFPGHLADFYSIFQVFRWYYPSSRLKKSSHRILLSLGWGICPRRRRWVCVQELDGNQNQKMNNSTYS